MMFSMLLSGSVALIAGGGSFAVTRSHYQKKIRALEARLRELRRSLREREEELEQAQAELAELREKLEICERRLAELTSNIQGLQDLSIDLDRRLAEHDTFFKKTLAAITLRIGEHRRDGERLRQRLVETQRSADSQLHEETGLQAEVVDLKSDMQTRETKVQHSESNLRERTQEIEKAESDLRNALGA